MSDSSQPPGTGDHPAPLSMELPRQEYWSGFPFPPPRDCPVPGIEPMSPESPSGFLTTGLGGSDSKDSACNTGGQGSIPESGRSPGEGNGYPLQYSCLGNTMDRRAWQPIQSMWSRSQTWLSVHTHTHTPSSLKAPSPNIDIFWGPGGLGHQHRDLGGNATQPVTKVVETALKLQNYFLNLDSFVFLPLLFKNGPVSTSAGGWQIWNCTMEIRIATATSFSKWYFWSLGRVLL